MEEGDQAGAQNDDDIALTAEPQPAAAPTAPRSRRATLVRVGAAVLVIAAAVLLRLFVYESDIVEGGSMAPGLRSGDYVLISRLAYRSRPPRRFDVVTFRAPGPDGREVAVKRVVAMPGEWVWAWRGQVFVNGGHLVEPYVRSWRGGLSSPVWVPEGHVYVLGDNRDDSEDSRAWGPIPLSSVRGKAILRYFPPPRAGRIK